MLARESGGGGRFGLVDEGGDLALDLPEGVLQRGWEQLGRVKGRGRVNREGSRVGVFRVQETAVLRDLYLVALEARDRRVDVAGGELRVNVPRAHLGGFFGKEGIVPRGPAV